MKLQIIAFCLALAGCATNIPANNPQVTSVPIVTPAIDGISDKTAFAAARAAVLTKLRDPDSAKFGPLRRQDHVLNGHPADVVCGSVNSKNGFGGYVGAEPFVYKVAGEHAGLVTFDGDVPTFPIATNVCGKL